MNREMVYERLDKWHKAVCDYKDVDHEIWGIKYQSENSGAAFFIVGILAVFLIPLVLLIGKLTGTPLEWKLIVEAFNEKSYFNISSDMNTIFVQVAALSIFLLVGCYISGFIRHKIVSTNANNRIAICETKKENAVNQLNDLPDMTPSMADLLLSDSPMDTSAITLDEKIMIIELTWDALQNGSIHISEHTLDIMKEAFAAYRQKKFADTTEYLLEFGRISRRINYDITKSKDTSNSSTCGQCKHFVIDTFSPTVASCTKKSFFATMSFRPACSDYLQK